MIALPRFHAPRLLTALAVAALACGAGVWGAILLAPSPGALPPAVAAAPPRGADMAPVAAWFGAAPVVQARIRVSVSGVMSAGPQGVAILAVDGGAARAWSVGQEIAPGVRLARIEGNTVTLDQQGESLQVSMPAAPPLSSPGFVRAP